MGELLLSGMGLVSIVRPADFDGNFRSDTAVGRPANGGWYVQGITRFNYGLSGDIPVALDFNGDNTTDRALYLPLAGPLVYLRRHPDQFRRRGRRPRRWSDGLMGERAVVVGAVSPPRCGAAGPECQARA